MEVNIYVLVIIFALMYVAAYSIGYFRGRSETDVHTIQLLSEWIIKYPANYQNCGLSHSTGKACHSLCCRTKLFLETRMKGGK